MTLVIVCPRDPNPRVERLYDSNMDDYMQKIQNFSILNRHLRAFYQVGEKLPREVKMLHLIIGERKHEITLWKPFGVWISTDKMLGQAPDPCQLLLRLPREAPISL